MGGPKIAIFGYVSMDFREIGQFVCRLVDRSADGPASLSKKLKFVHPCLPPVRLIGYD